MPSRPPSSSRGLPVVSLESATLRLRSRQLFHHTSWQIRQGEHWLIQGPNGAGKSTLVRALFESVPLSRGHIHHHHGLQPAQAVGYVSFELHQDLVGDERDQAAARHFSGHPDQYQSAREAIRQAASATPFGHEEMDTLANRFGLNHLLDRPLTALSVGELRKTLIIRAFLKKPRLLILDEPFEGLDQNARHRLRETLTQIANRQVPILLVTHRTGEIPSFITHQVQVTNGRIVYQGPFDPGFKNPVFESPPILVPPMGRNDMGSRDHQTSRAPAELIRMHKVHLRYGDQHVLKDFSWCFRKGQHWALLGPNGSGKTTIAKLAAGDHPQAYANRIWLFGCRRGQGESIWDIRRQVGMVSTELQLNMNRTWRVMEVVLSGYFDSIGLYRHATATQLTAAQKWLAWMGIEHLAQRRYDRLSAGERRMTMLARAMVKRPLLLILDEPCQGLDQTNRHRILNLIEAIGGSQKTHLLFITHHPRELVPCITHKLELPSQQKAAWGRYPSGNRVVV